MSNGLSSIWISVCYPSLVVSLLPSCSWLTQLSKHEEPFRISSQASVRLLLRRGTMCRWEWGDKAQVSWFLLHRLNFRCFQPLLICTTRVGSHAGFAGVSGNANGSAEPCREGCLPQFHPVERSIAGRPGVPKLSLIRAKLQTVFPLRGPGGFSEDQA